MTLTNSDSQVDSFKDRDTESQYQERDREKDRKPGGKTRVKKKWSVQTIMTRKEDKGDQRSGGETTWTNTGATRYGRGRHKTG